ncbi:MAG: hypothetical protein A2932_02520 [Candidatus Spechtbacteria bacterium RIFCSPLOWO2_01_FULL_46_10]|uniref:Transcription elongation factor GreA n=1 Tax=Candidatus Spechtbacteria bacterium RIFCSPLOWO2_01_FULL_46_10 TaxID=1802163 RepID=A0A1G2HIY9_9BACT|nr:MAG: hypothetical protein A2932_02520 [Candidatus Spechtbacteria bacterium RIFCSPLOWO2_01_FULL_46_10]
MKLTQESYNKLHNELEKLETKERPEVAQLLKEAIEQGDLSENAAYEEAKDRQSHLEKRIHELKNLLGKAEITQTTSDGTVGVGSVIKVRSQEGEERKFTITDASDASPALGKISYDSPLGEAFLNRQVSEIIEAQTPAGPKKYTILEIK